MSTPFLDLADEIADALTTFAAGEYTATREYIPNWSETGSAVLACAVVPSNHESETLDRSASVDSVTIDVGFTKRLQDQTKAELDALASLVHAAFAYLKPTGAAAVVTVGSVRYRSARIAYKAVYDPDKLAGKGGGNASGQFLSVFSITYQVFP